QDRRDVRAAAREHDRLRRERDLAAVERRGPPCVPVGSNNPRAELAPQLPCGGGKIHRLQLRYTPWRAGARPASPGGRAGAWRPTRPAPPPPGRARWTPVPRILGLLLARHFPDLHFEVSFYVSIQVGGASGARGGLNALHHFRGPRLLFDLFVDEPVHEDLGGGVLCRKRRLVDGVDVLRVGVLLGLRLQGDIEQRLELLLRGGQRSHLRRHAAVGQVLEDSLRVRALLGRLLDEVLAEALEVPDIAPDRQREIRVRGREFLVELAVQLCDHFLRDFGFEHDGCGLLAPNNRDRTVNRNGPMGKSCFGFFCLQALPALPPGPADADNAQRSGYTPSIAEAGRRMMARQGRSKNNQQGYPSWQRKAEAAE